MQRMGAGQNSRFWMRQNRRFWKWDKTADLENETKPPILKCDKTADFVKENKLPSKLFLWWKRLGVIIDN